MDVSLFGLGGGIRPILVAAWIPLADSGWKTKILIGVWDFLVKFTEHLWSEQMKERVSSQCMMNIWNSAPQR